MPWFGVSLLFKSEVSNQLSPDEIWEEEIRILMAESEADAIKDADRIGSDQEHSYLNMENMVVKFTYQGILGTWAVLGPLDCGRVIFSRPLTTWEVGSLLKRLHEAPGPGTPAEGNG